MRIEIATLFPDMCETVLSESIIGRARRAGKLDIHCRNIRDYTLDKHRRVDDTPYGGGKGMLMQAEPIYRCYEAVCEDFGARPHVIFMSPQGKPFTEKRAIELSQMEHILILCGHYEGVDQRVIDATMCSPAASWGPWWWWMQLCVCARVSWQTRVATWTRATTTACWSILITPARRYGMDGRCRRCSRMATMPRSTSGAGKSHWKTPCASVRICSGQRR